MEKARTQVKRREENGNEAELLRKEIKYIKAEILSKSAVIAVGVPIITGTMGFSSYKIYGALSHSNMTDFTAGTVMLLAAAATLYPYFNVTKDWVAERKRLKEHKATENVLRETKELTYQ